jgi:hypothetical protein
MTPWRRLNVDPVFQRDDAVAQAERGSRFSTG